MFDTPQLKCFETSAQTINYRRQHGAVMEGARGQRVNVSTQSPLCQNITSTGSWMKAEIPRYQKADEKSGMQFHLRILFLFMVLTAWPLFPISSSVRRSRWITLDGWVSTEQTQLLAGSSAWRNNMEKAGGEGFYKSAPLTTLLLFTLQGLVPVPPQSMIISLLTSAGGLSFWRAMAPDPVSPPVMLGTEPEQLLFCSCKCSWLVFPSEQSSQPCFVFPINGFRQRGSLHYALALPRWKESALPQEQVWGRASASVCGGGEDPSRKEFMCL